MGHCSFPKCGVQRIEKYRGIAIFTVTRRKDAFHSNWRKNLVDVLSLYRVMDNSYKRSILNGEIYMCEKHFSPDNIELTKTGKKSLRLNALPTQNLPSKSQDKPKTERTPVERHDIDFAVNRKQYCYNTFEEFCSRI